LLAATHDAGYELRNVEIPDDEYQGFYLGFANSAIWPLFHDMPSLCRFVPSDWTAAEKVNHRFASEVVQHAAKDDFIWVHDYQLLGTGRALREAGVTGRIGFFLHVPFPPLDLFMKLPWRFPVLHALLEYDVIGVQTGRDRRNLLQCIHALLPEAKVQARGRRITVQTATREVRLGAFPIGIDFRAFDAAARSDDVQQQAATIRADEPNRSILFGVDRLDYTKGLSHRLEAFATALETYPELRGKVTLVQFVVPSREAVPRYAEFKRDLERMVGEINGRFTRSGWVPVHYVFRSLDRTRLLAYYRASDVALVTPLKDGMNLVAKEYCAANPHGVLILSEFAGAAGQLQHGALLVNPYDVLGTAAAIAQAVAMEPAERRSRMRRMRRSCREHDIYWWQDAYLRTAVSIDVDDYASVAEYMPTATFEPQ
jgi:trehalose 6-phosphate synthase